MSRSSKSVFKVLIVNLDGTKYGVMVDHVPGDKASVTIDQIELAISNNAELASRGILGHSLEYEVSRRSESSLQELVPNHEFYLNSSTIKISTNSSSSGELPKSRIILNCVS